eukprot:CAMPEP_0202707494 /NCGR_PEP_ID=MMETSP1385-20130828/19833_1 /ASSEMBLY_ACC=CAM_ASM_000861 /TAXON_ID=933848 /ORGANISM="Elphidium margaritaceum" /LENGTH=67 /DNA_ID=CAMNT_0049366233 /DNA_START=92 /DNA_END=291 /DNA_ORIENTATION=+
MLLSTNAIIAVSNDYAYGHPDSDPHSIPISQAIVEEKKWGETYEPSRIWCLVPTLYPRNTENMKAIS